MDIWVMHADGTSKHRLTSGDGFDTEPTWSPEGGTIAFRRSGSGATTIMLVAAGGGVAAPLGLVGNDRMPAWSPDARLIAFARFPAGGGSPQLYTVRPDGSAARLRTTDYTWNGGTHPAWIRSR
jgi:TolB protein